jgi:hypothetical protein
LPLVLVGCGSDQTGFDNSGSGGKGGPDSGLSSGGNGESGSGGAMQTAGGAGGRAGGGTGATSSAGTSPGGADAESGGSSGEGGPGPGADSSAGGSVGGPDGATGGSVNPDSGSGTDSGSGGCPKGSSRVGGKCLKDVLQACTAGTECGSGNCVGGACCSVACTTPGACEKQAGTVCQSGNTCVYGKQADGTADPKCDTGDKCAQAATCFAGACAPGAAVNCEDTNPCTIDTCDAVNGCLHTAIDLTKAGNECDDSNVCTTDTCSPTAGCQHANANGVKTGCDDKNPCTNDVCAGGLCVSTALDCSAKADDCHTGVCVAGACQAQIANVNAACDMNRTTCDTGGKCDATGACVSTGAACGTLSTACQPCTTGATCSANRICTCTNPAPIDVVVNGVCVVNTDDCATSPCGPNGTACHDPTPDGSKKGDFTCTCAKGYSQKAVGAACTDIDECTGGANPCGAGTCANTVGSYDCTCAAPLTKIQAAAGPQCACNLAGTYALVAKTVVTYAPITLGTPPAAITVIEGSPPGGLAGTAWALRYNTVDAAKGTLTSQTITCGGSTVDLCDVVFSQAHAQYEPTTVFGQPAMNSGFAPITTPLAGVVPGGKYTEPTTFGVAGIKLDDPAGAWPVCAECVGLAKGSTCNKCPGGTFTVSNGSQWLNNPDGLGHLGFTTFAVPRGGLATTAPNPPPYAFPALSVCPRNSTPHNTYPYEEFPGIATDGTAFHAYSWHAASRVQAAYTVDSKVSGQSISNQCTLTGVITGPDSGHAKTEARVQGCEVCGTSPTDPNACVKPGSICNPAQLDSYDRVSQTQQIASATFTMAPAPAGVGNLGTVLAMPDSPAKTAAIGNACALVRTAYPPVIQ